MFHPGVLEAPGLSTTSKWARRKSRRGRPDPINVSVNITDSMHRLSMGNRANRNSQEGLFTVQNGEKFEKPDISTSTKVFGENIPPKKQNDRYRKWTARRQSNKSHRIYNVNQSRLSNIGQDPNIDMCTKSNIKKADVNFFDIDREKGFTFGQKSAQSSNRKRKGKNKNHLKQIPEKCQQKDQSMESVFASFVESKTKPQTSIAEELKQEGNSMLKQGQYAKAEEIYNKALRTLKDDQDAHHLSSVLLTNRAAARIHQMKITLALKDCQKAKEQYPKNIRAYTRAASCQTIVGSLVKAEQTLERASLMLSSDDYRYHKVVTQMIEVQKLKSELESVEMKYKSGSDENLLLSLDNLMAKMNYSELVWRLMALVSLRSEDFYQTHHRVHEMDKRMKYDKSLEKNRPWWCWIKLLLCWHDTSKKTIDLLIIARELIQIMRLHSLSELDISPSNHSIIKLQSLEDILKLEEVDLKKARGNEFFAQKQYSEAEEVYTSALEQIRSIGAPCNLCAVLYCNRAAALHGQGRYLDAMRDAFVAVSMNHCYATAYLRLGQMYLELRLPEETNIILQEMKQNCMEHSSRQSQQSEILSHECQSMKNGDPHFDAYKFMGLSMSASNAEIKVAFRKLALKVHPDKALMVFQFKSDWMDRFDDFYQQQKEKRIQERLRNFMQRLFKQLNEANLTLLDYKAREILDQELFFSHNKKQSPKYNRSSY